MEKNLDLIPRWCASENRTPSFLARGVCDVCVRAFTERVCHGKRITRVTSPSSLSGYGLVLHNRPGCSKRLPLHNSRVERRSIKSGRDWKARYIFGGQPIDGRARALVTRLGTLPAGAYLRNNVSLNREMSECPPSSSIERPARKNHRAHAFVRGISKSRSCRDNPATRYSWVDVQLIS